MRNLRLRKYAIASAKLGLATVILVYLIQQAQQHESFRRLVDQPKRWDLLSAAVALMAATAAITFVRWYLLVRALGLRFRLNEAIRLGSLGYVLNLVSLGTVGGDLFKAVLIAKGQPGKRTEAVATVILDRVVGLYALLLVAAVALLFADVRNRGGAIAAACNVTLVCTVLATAGLMVLMIPSVTGSKTEQRLAGLPLAGPTLARLLAAIRVYRRQPFIVVVAVLMSVVVHIFLTWVILCIAHGLPGAVPHWADHFVLVPLGMVAGALPLTPNGLGTFEAAMELLYYFLGQSQGVVQGTGTIVALGYRLVNIVVAGFAAAYYLLVSGRLPTLADASEHEATPGETTALE